MHGVGLFWVVRRILLFQAVTALAVSVFWLLWSGVEPAISALIGGLVGFIPNAYFAVKSGRYNPAHSSRDVVRSFYLGETIKLISTALLFSVAFQIPGILFVPLITGFISVIMVFWCALLWRN
jgi:ATP synthase protein I